MDDQPLVYSKTGCPKCGQTWDAEARLAELRENTEGWERGFAEERAELKDRLVEIERQLKICREIRRELVIEAAQQPRYREALEREAEIAYATCEWKTYERVRAVLDGGVVEQPEGVEGVSTMAPWGVGVEPEALGSYAEAAEHAETERGEWKQPEDSK